jgi:hypothetical protein
VRPLLWGDTGSLLKAVKLYLDKRLDAHWGVVKEV